MIIQNAFVTVQRAGNYVYGGPLEGPIFVQIDDGSVSEDTGGVDIMAGSSTAGAPTLPKTLYSMVGLDIQRGDVITILALTGQPDPPQNNPFYVLRVQKPGDPLAATEVSMNRYDMLNLACTWFPVITAATPGAARTATYDVYSHQGVGANTASLNDTWTAPDDLTDTQRIGYLSPRPITISLNEFAIQHEMTPMGLMEWEPPVIICERNLVNPYLYPYQKGDLIVLPDLRRIVIEDLGHFLQRTGVIMACIYKVSVREPADAVYTIS
jgi:hypothetical protein